MSNWRDDFIAAHGIEAYEKRLAQMRAYHEAHKEEDNARAKKYKEEHLEEEKAYNKEWREEHPEKGIAANQELCRKGGRRYEKMLKYQTTGLRGERNKIRMKHSRQYKPYKDIIAPDSQLHHEWCPQSASYTGLALVEADQHMYGFIDVIEILAGKITLFTEEEIRNGGEEL
jgi:hypothetical protein